MVIHFLRGVLIRGRNRRTHTEESKQEAIRPIIEEGYSTAEAARNLGIKATINTLWHAG